VLRVVLKPGLRRFKGGGIKGLKIRITFTLNLYLMSLCPMRTNLIVRMISSLTATRSAMRTNPTAIRIRSLI